MHVPCQSGFCNVHCDSEQCFLHAKNKAFGFCAFSELGHPFFFVSDSQPGPTHLICQFSVVSYMVLYTALQFSIDHFLW